MKINKDEYVLMRTYVTKERIFADLYNENTQTNFEINVRVSAKKCVDKERLLDVLCQYSCTTASLFDWIKTFELIERLYYYRG